MLKKILVPLALTICLAQGLISSSKAMCKQTTDNFCRYWQSKVDEQMESSGEVQKIDENNPDTVMLAIECLLKMEGNRHPAKFSGAVKDNVSQQFEPATADVAALYYVSYLFYQKWDHANAVALSDEKGRLNSRKAISRAYTSYKRWFEEVKRIGLAEARKAKLDPLKGETVHWY